MAQSIDYRSIDLPDEEPYEEWTYGQRRAFLLEELKEVGHPRLLHNSEIADQFGVNPSTITRDLDALGEYVGEQVGDRRQLRTAAVVDRCIAELLEDGRWKDAGKLALEFDEWITRETTLSEMEQQLNALLSGATSGKTESADAGGVALELEGDD